MSDRKYSVSDIDRIRAAVTMREDYTTYWERPYMPDERIRHIEELVRTYLLGGVLPDDIENQCKKIVADMQEMRRQFQRQR